MPTVRRAWWRLTYFVFVMLVIEFLDEFAYSALEASRPLIRNSFGLNYVQISLITTVPVLVALIIEPIVGLYANTGKRRVLMVFGALTFGIGLILQGVSSVFPVFLLGATFQAPASGVFVNLAQASLMDDATDRRENRMALWTLSGSLAVVVGPLALTAMTTLGSNWRPLFIGTGLVSALVAVWIMRLPPNPALRMVEEAENDEKSLRQRLHDALVLLRSRDIWRWLVLLEFSDLMLDVLFGFLALYMVDVVGVTPAEAGLAVALWTGVGLVGDFLLIPLLERINGLVYLRFSALVVLFLFPAVFVG